MSKMTSMRWMTLAAVVAVLTVIICAFLFRSQIWVAVTCSGGKPQSELEGPVVQAWVATYDGPGGEWNGDNDHAVAIQTDSLGNVYVTGSSGTIKYDSAGNELWVTSDDPAGGYNAPKAMAVDAMGNVYVTGLCSYDYATTKYDHDGNRLWIVYYDSGGDGRDMGSAVCVDQNGNVIVSGTVDCGDRNRYSTYGKGYATIKYDSDGNELWAAQYTGSEEHKAEAIGIDSEGNVYVTGSPSTVKYTVNGTQSWVTDHQGRDLALDTHDNIYVTSGYGTVKYDSEGNLLWSDTNKGRALALDAFGNLYLTGTGTAKYDSAGNLLWTNTTIGSDLAVDALGNTYVTIYNTVGIPNYYTTVKFGKDGEHLWTATLNGPVGRDDEARAVAVDPSGNIYVTGTITASKCTFWMTGRSYTDYATVKYTNQVD